MKINNFFSALVLFLVSGCGSDGGGDNYTINDIVDKNWYYNGWMNNKFGYSTPDALQVMRLDANNRLVGMEFSGRRDSISGSWSADGWLLDIEFENGNTEAWNILGYEHNELSVNNGWGTRKYTSEPYYLSGLSGDAFWFNEYDRDYRLVSRLQYEIIADNLLKESYAILSDRQKIELNREGNRAFGASPLEEVDFEGEHRIRFYCRIGSGNYVKFDERLYADNLPERMYGDYNLRAEWELKGTLDQVNITWTPYERSDVYYKIEVLDNALSTVYFESFGLPKVDHFVVNENTKGSINKMRSLGKGKAKVRLTIILYEPGIDPNSKNADINIQAKTCLTKAFIWGE